MRSEKDRMRDEAEVMQSTTKLPMNTFMPNPWTSKAKKNTVVTFEVDGKKTSLPIVAFLKQEALKLPPMIQNGKRVVHFDQLWWHFMHGNTKAESQQAVNDYCAEVVDIWNKAVEEQKAKTESHE